MKRQRNNFERRNKNRKSGDLQDTELDKIRKDQEQYHRSFKNSSGQNSDRIPSTHITVLLEDGSSVYGKVLIFSNPKMPKSRIYFKTKTRRELVIDADINLKLESSEKLAELKSFISNYLQTLHEEAVLEFPAWLEKYSTRAKESNPFFNLDEIREEFQYRKSRFGFWRVAAEAGFFDDLKPQTAKVNKIMRIEIPIEIKCLGGFDKENPPLTSGYCKECKSRVVCPISKWKKVENS